MMSAPDEEKLSHEQRQWVKNLREQYTPPERTPAQRVAFNNAVTARIHRRRIPVWQPIAAVACSVALAFWLLSPGGPGDTGQVAEEDRGEVMVTLALGDDEVAYADDVLPDDYAILVEVFDL